MEDDFDALIAELGTLSKAMPAPGGDDKIKAAAEEGGNDVSTVTGGGEGGEGEGEGEGAGGEEDDALGKSFAVTLPDGTVQEAFDATDLVKSFAARLDAAETAATADRTELETAKGELVATKGELAKALTVASELVKLVKTQADQFAAQDTLIKSLQSDVSRIGSQPQGRKTLLTVAEKTTGPATAAGPKQEEIMAKAMTALEAGRIRGVDISRLEARFNSGQDAPADILARLA